MATLKANQFHLIEDLDIAAFTYRGIDRIESIFTAMISTVKVWAARNKDRRNLALLSDRILLDIGLNRVEVEFEMNKYFWQK